MGGGETRNHDGSGNDLGIGKPGDPRPTLTSGDRHAVAVGFDGDVARTLTARYDSSPCSDRGQNVICVVNRGHYREDEISETLRSNSHGDLPCVAAFLAGQGAKAGSIGYQEEISPTLRSVSSGTNQVPAVIAFTQNQRNGVRDLQNLAGAIAAESGMKQQTYIAQINCTPEGIAGTMSSKWAKGTGGPAGDEHYNLIAYGLDEEKNGYREQYGTLQARKDSGGFQGCVAQRYTVRRLTPLECERLQGYPDGWTDIPGASDSARYKALGNSVAIPCVEYVMEGIMTVFEKE